MSTKSLPELIFDVVGKTALLLHEGQAILLKGTFVSVADARAAAAIQHPSLFPASQTGLDEEAADAV